MSKTFTPWLSQLFSGLTVTTGGLGIAYIARADHPYVAIAGLGVTGIGVAILKRAQARERGQRVERKAISELKLPENWTVEPNHMLPWGADLDLLITSPDGARFAVEIKSYEGALLKRSFFGREESLVRLNGKKFDQDPIGQALRAAEAVDATPIIWMPAAKSSKTFPLKNGVIVVQGHQRQLKQALGATTWWWPF